MDVVFASRDLKEICVVCIVVRLIFLDYQARDSSFVILFYSITVLALLSLFLQVELASCRQSREC